jgi:hypothetical protein
MVLLPLYLQCIILGLQMNKHKLPTQKIKLHKEFCNFKHYNLLIYQFDWADFFKILFEIYQSIRSHKYILKNHNKFWDVIHFQRVPP